jgi:hypothetical protein
MIVVAADLGVEEGGEILKVSRQIRDSDRCRGRRREQS